MSEPPRESAPQHDGNFLRIVDELIAKLKASDADCDVDLPDDKPQSAEEWQRLIDRLIAVLHEMQSHHQVVVEGKDDGQTGDSGSPRQEYASRHRMPRPGSRAEAYVSRFSGDDIVGRAG